MRSLLEEVEIAKVYSSENWKNIESKFPKLAKDFKLYIDKSKFKDFIELANQVIDANAKNKTNAMFPKIDKETWECILNVIKYMQKEDPRLKTGAKFTNDIWSHEPYSRDKVREELDALSERIENLLTEALNHMGEREQTTWAGWKAACKKAYPEVWFDGDRDIANAMVGPKPYVKGKTIGVGEWDGEKGSVYNKK
jgi:hypothetical protein